MFLIAGRDYPGEGYAAHIFERFYRIEGDRAHGTGIGLHLCRRIVEAHDGTITVESKVGEGSRFIVHLPIAERDVIW